MISMNWKTCLVVGALLLATVQAARSPAVQKTADNCEFRGEMQDVIETITCLKSEKGEQVKGRLVDTVADLHGLLKKARWSSKVPADSARSLAQDVLHIVNEIIELNSKLPVQVDGRQNVVRGGSSSMSGTRNNLNGGNSVLAGTHTELNGDDSLAFGENSDICGDHSFAVGNGLKVRGDNTIAFGSNRTIYGSNKLAIDSFIIDLKELRKNGRLLVTSLPRYYD